MAVGMLRVEVPTPAKQRSWVAVCPPTIRGQCPASPAARISCMPVGVPAGQTSTTSMTVPTDRIGMTNKGVAALPRAAAGSREDKVGHRGGTGAVVGFGVLVDDAIRKLFT